MTQIVSPQVRFTWDISYDCNFRCSYCFFDGKWEDYKDRTVYLSVEEWVRHWEKVCQKYGPIVLIITGGEPFIYPDFIRLVERLSQLCHHINISSNGSGDLKSFVETVRPEKVSLSLSFQREFDTLSNFIEKVKFIRKYKFEGCLNIVAYPPYLDKLADDNRQLSEETGEEFKIIAFFGQWNGKEYPDSYTAEERKLIGITEDWFEKVKRKNSFCNAGHTSGLIFPNGKVARCGQIGERLLVGNFFDPQFALFDGPLLCDVEYCPCAEYSVTGDDSGLEAKPVEKEAAEEPKDAHLDELLAINRSLAALKDKINFAWDIHYKCNFRCPYCWFFDNWAQQAKRNLYLSVQEWMEIWRRIYDKYGETRIAITGGEPFIYPNFIELVKAISSLHIVKITTNMSGNIEKFVQEISPKRVYLDLNFHAVFVKDLNEYIRKVKLLHNAGFDAGVCYLAYPPQMGLIESYKQIFEKNGIRFALAAYWGKYLGKQYPAAYSPEERELIKPFLGEVARVDYHMNATSPYGKKCNAGYRYANIQGDGKVVRCAQYADRVMGNITDKDFSLFPEPLPCEQNVCPGNEYDNIISC